MVWVEILTYGGSAVLLAAVTPILLGFGTAGVGAGTVAAGLQSGIGNVAAGSYFAGATSLAMKGVFVKGACAGGTSMAAGVAGVLMKDKDKNDEP